MSSKLEDLKREYDNIPVPKEGLEQTKRAMDRAVFDKKKREQKWKKTWVGVAAAVAVFITLPNLNGTVASALEKIPVLGKAFEVVCFRDYQYDDGHNLANVQTPEVTATGDLASNGAKEATKEAQDYVDELTEQFKQDIKDTGESYNELDVTYDVVRDTDTWFTLKINALSVKASGYEQIRYYNVDKKTDTLVKLSDLFETDSDYVTLISDEIKRQMRAQMADPSTGADYFIDSTDMPEYDFKEIQEDQNFYLDQENRVVIAFDEYEVAPGCMGAVQFTIPEALIDQIRIR